MNLEEVERFTKPQLIAVLDEKYPYGAYAHEWRRLTKKELVDFYFFPHPRRTTQRSPRRSRRTRSPHRSRSPPRRTKSPRR